MHMETMPSEQSPNQPDYTYQPEVVPSRRQFLAEAMRGVGALAAAATLGCSTKQSVEENEAKEESMYQDLAAALAELQRKPSIANARACRDQLMQAATDLGADYNDGQGITFAQFKARNEQLQALYHLFETHVEQLGLSKHEFIVPVSNRLFSMIRMD